MRAAATRLGSPRLRGEEMRSPRLRGEELGVAMYVAFLALMLALGGALVARGVKRGLRNEARLGIAVLGFTALFFALLGFWSDLLWFDALGMSKRFWTAFFARSGTALVAGALAAALVAFVSMPARRVAPRAWHIGTAVAGALGLLWGATAWNAVLRWLYSVDTGVRDPILARDAGFYLFSLPFLDALLGLFAVANVIASVVAAWSAFGQGLLGRAGVAQPIPGASERRSLTRAVAGWFFVLAFGSALQVFHQFFSRAGVVFGPGWTDVHVRIPAYVVLAVVLALGGASLLLSHRPVRFARPAIGAGVVWLIGVGALPLLVDWLVVTPNELALERPYLMHNIAFTRRGFGLDKAEEREFDPSGSLSPEVIEKNEHLLSEVRLWDPNALDQVFEQFQEIRLYYEMTGVDIDRYTVDGRYRQVMVAPRELETGNLPPESRTFVNRHFKYTHGFGLAMAPVSDFQPDGLPRLLVKDIPPVSEHADVAVSRPEIYFGEATDDYVIARSRAAEFDHPSGSDNAYVSYAGSGGVELKSFWRKLVFGWTLGGTRLLFSEYPKTDSRVLYRRNVRDRVATVAPFLELDSDPYIVLVEGRMKWIIDGYTTSTYYPYSEPFARRDEVRAKARAEEAAHSKRPRPDGGAEVNWIRNSVKAVVDAYDGSVTLYVFDAEDPVLRVWRRIFPELFRPSKDMPAGLRAHVRYPEGLLHRQGIVYAKYHMTDPEVFYNQEDLWVRATEKHYGDVQAVDPYYVMWQAPGASKPEFIVMQPYTPKHRQVLIGWIAGMCDGDNYGRFLAYRFPKDRRVLGPQQVDTKIDQDPELSGQLTLWNQHGKRVIRGNVLAIPIADTILFVEPIYLQAQAAAYPELRVVVTMHGDDMSYAPTFRQALDGLLSLAAPAAAARARVTPDDPTANAEALSRAERAFDAYVRAMGEGRFEDAAAELGRLREALKEHPALPSR
jgi:uncharacterized protein